MRFVLLAAAVVATVGTSDQVMAQKIGARTRFSSLELVVGNSTYNTKETGGLANMSYRAVQVGGSCEISRPPEGGTRVRWIAPLADH